MDYDIKVHRGVQKNTGTINMARSSQHPLTFQLAIIYPFTVNDLTVTFKLGMVPTYSTRNSFLAKNIQEPGSTRQDRLSLMAMVTLLEMFPSL